MPMRGETVLYMLSLEDSEAINRRYEDARNELERIREDRPGLQAHIGMMTMGGDIFGAVVTAVHSSECVNLKVFLDGNDDFWVRQAYRGRGPGNWNTFHSPMALMAGQPSA